MTRDERATLRDDKPGVWVPVDPGDVLDGEVVEVASAWSDVQYDGRDSNSGFYPLLRVKVGEANGYEPGAILAVHCFSTVLRDRVMTQQPHPGERAIFTYDGEGEKKPGRNAPQLYRVELPDRDPAEAAKQVYSTMSTRRSAPTPGGPPASVQEPLPAGRDASDEDIPF